MNLDESVKRESVDNSDNSDSSESITSSKTLCEFVKDNKFIISNTCWLLLFIIERLHYH